MEKMVNFAIVKVERDNPDFIDVWNVGVIPEKEYDELDSCGIFEECGMFDDIDNEYDAEKAEIECDDSRDTWYTVYLIKYSDEEEDKIAECIQNIKWIRKNCFKKERVETRRMKNREYAESEEDAKYDWNSTDC